MNGIKADPDVKMELDAVTPSGSGYMDDDFHEDIGEMTLPKEDTKTDVWLARIPEWLYEAVSKWDNIADGNDNDQIQIGEVLGFATTSGIDQTKPMRIFLNDQWKAKSNLPTAFQLDPSTVSDTLLGNTYVFTEKDMPGYRGGNHGYARGGAQGGFGGITDPKAKVQKRSKYKKAIPKQTALIGHATRQYQANPLETAEYKEFNARRIKQAIQGSHTVTVMANDSDVHDVRTTNALTDRFKNFIKPANNKVKTLNKANRISRSELIDLLHACFDKYQYWAMKTLKKETNQPEQFLKEVLGDIAYLVKSGPFASHWQRQAIFDKDRDVRGQAGAAPAAEGDSDGEEEMEDVV